MISNLKSNYNSGYEIVRAEVDLSGSVLALIRVEQRPVRPFNKKHSLVVELYREGRLSLSKAAELAGVKSKREMLMLLSERGVPLDYIIQQKMQMTCGHWKQCWADDRRLQLHALK